MFFFDHFRRSRRERQSLGKFPHDGPHTEPPVDYRDWSFRVRRRRAGITRSRQLYQVVIDPPDGESPVHLNGFRSAGEAAEAAREKIDEQIARRERNVQHRRRRQAAKTLRAVGRRHQRREGA